MGAFSNMDYELQNSGAAVSDAFTEDDDMDMPQAAPVESMQQVLRLQFRLRQRWPANR